MYILYVVCVICVYIVSVVSHRFAFSFHATGKLDDFVSFPEMLDMRPYLSQSQVSNEHLISVQWCYCTLSVTLMWYLYLLFLSQSNFQRYLV